MVNWFCSTALCFNSYKSKDSKNIHDLLDISIPDDQFEKIKQTYTTAKGTLLRKNNHNIKKPNEIRDWSAGDKEPSKSWSM